MMASELGSSGAAEISVFHKLLPGKGRNPPRPAFCPGIICWQEEVELPVPPPEPPDPLDPPGLLLVDEPGVVVQPVKYNASKSRQANKDWFHPWLERMRLFFRAERAGKRERQPAEGRNQDKYERNDLSENRW